MRVPIVRRDRMSFGEIHIPFWDDSGHLRKQCIVTNLNFWSRDDKRTTWTFQKRAMLELTHNWGSESSNEVSYHNGNSEPRGFGHIGFSVPDVYKAAKRFEELNVKFVKRPDDGKMKGLAFIEDPDGYWIEILQANMIEKNSA